jgi:hypothetical protein
MRPQAVRISLPFLVRLFSSLHDFLVEKKGGQVGAIFKECMLSFKRKPTSMHLAVLFFLWSFLSLSFFFLYVVVDVYPSCTAFFATISAWRSAALHMTAKWDLQSRMGTLERPLYLIRRKGEVMCEGLYFLCL